MRRTVKYNESTAPMIFLYMNTLKDVEQAIKQLSSDELAAFRAWFAEFDAEIWDRQFEENVAAGRLDRLGEKVLRHLQEGR